MLAAIAEGPSRLQIAIYDTDLTDVPIGGFPAHSPKLGKLGRSVTDHRRVIDASSMWPKAALLADSCPRISALADRRSSLPEMDQGDYLGSP
jgi:hypothetical protein